ncbi:MAG: Crp/Fnr family transcriptional regulator [Treponema sp.]|nr:Crp/Fnr family transcriptional regulator [Treponema sp.]
MDLDSAAFNRFTRTFNSNEIIFCEYEVGDTFYLIRSGRVKLVKNSGDVERAIDILQPSEMFGEMAILDNSPRSATAIALDKVSVLEFNAQNFEILVLENPQIAFKLLRLFAKRIYDSKRRFMILTLQDPQAKVADVFLMLDETQSNIDKSNTSREFQVTVEDIAHWAGISLNQAKETLNHFAVQRRLEVFPDRMVVKNINDFIRFVSTRRSQK